jgi:outer membrane protein assembly factor BamD
MKNRTILYISAVLILLASCSGFEKLVKSTDYELKYTEARRYYDKEDYYRAQVLYDQIAPIFRGTAKADSVYYMQAMSYYMQKDYILAGHYFSTFARTYGASEFVEEADFMAAYCFYHNSPRPELDQDYTIKSIQTFSMYLIKYPNGEKRDEAQMYIEELKNKLVEKSYISARLYYDLERYKASLVALNNSLIDYPDSKYREQIMFMVFKSSFKYAEQSVFIKKKDRFQASLDDFYSFKAEFPESKYMREANRYYAVAAKYLGITEEETEIN